MGLRTFAELAICLNKQPFSLADRPYLRDVYDSSARQIVLRASRQVEKSTFLVNAIVHSAVTKPGRQILFVSPRREQAHLFSRMRLAACVLQSPGLRKLLWPYRRAIPIEDIEFANGAHLFVRAAFHSADGARGISAHELFVDEFQDLAPGELPVLTETLSHAEDWRMILTGTPKMVDNHLEVAFGNSTACEWTIVCAKCSRSAILDERVIGPAGLVCPNCSGPLDPRQGHWVPRNPHSTWGDGYWINHTMVPWVNIAEILEHQREYDPVRFQNEVLGLPTTLGDHVITRQELEACCEDRPFVQAFTEVPAIDRSKLVAGIDWGGGSASGTVLVLGYIPTNLQFRILRMDRWVPHADPHTVLKEVAHLCFRFRVPMIAADGSGNGLVYNRLLLDRLHKRNQMPALYAIYYSAADQDPVRDGAITKWTVNRSASIATLFSRIKNRQILLPRVAECGTFLDEFTCVYRVYDEEMKRIRFTKPVTFKDDALHATNYAELLALRQLHNVYGHGRS